MCIVCYMGTLLGTVLNKLQISKLNVSKFEVIRTCCKFNKTTIIKKNKNVKQEIGGEEKKTRSKLRSNIYK